MRPLKIRLNPVVARVIERHGPCYGTHGIPALRSVSR